MDVNFGKDCVCMVLTKSEYKELRRALVNLVHPLSVEDTNFSFIKVVKSPYLYDDFKVLLEGMPALKVSYE